MYSEERDKNIFIKRKSYPWMPILTYITRLFVIIGAINWGLVGLNDFNAVDALFGPWLARPIYILVGLSGFLLFFSMLYRQLVKE